LLFKNRHMQFSLFSPLYSSVLIAAVLLVVGSLVSNNVRSLRSLRTATAVSCTAVHVRVRGTDETGRTRQDIKSR
jgi:hypothetical protein